MFSQQYQNNHIFDVFSRVIMHALVSICTEIKGCCWLCLLSHIFQFFCFAFLISESILLFRDFPWPSLQFHDFLCLEIEIIINSMTFQGEVTCATVIHNNYSMTLTPKHDIQQIRWMYLHLHVHKNNVTVNDGECVTREWNNKNM